jgi:hypothetical protein
MRRDRRPTEWWPGLVFGVRSRGSDLGKLVQVDIGAA